MEQSSCPKVIWAVHSWQRSLHCLHQRQRAKELLADIRQNIVNSLHSISIFSLTFPPSTLTAVEGDLIFPNQESNVSA